MSTHTLPRPSGDIEQDAFTRAQQQDAHAKQHIVSMINGKKLEIRFDYGRWLPVIEMLEISYASSSNGNRAKTVAEHLNSLFRTEKYSGLEELIFGKKASTSPQPSALQESNQINFPALPQSARLSEALSKDASLNMDRYVEYSRLVSPEGAEGFHEAAFLSLLSTINARRTRIDLGKDYCSLMIAFVADSTDYAKTMTVKAVENVLEAAGLSWFLGPGKTTPQRLIQEMTGIVPRDYFELAPPVQERIKMRLAFAGQRGWHAGEMGKMIKSMMNGNSAMADFQELLLVMDDNKDRYENATIARRTEVVEKPYLSILGCMTPPNLFQNAKAGAEFWSDGFWARWAFICPPDGTAIDSPIELGDFPPPGDLIFALRKWHYRLGVPTVVIEKRDEKGKDTEQFNVERGELVEEEAKFAEGVWDAWARYRSALKQLAKDSIPKDLKSSYGRLATKAIRVAALLASLENNGIIELKHFAKAMEIAERWRESLHELYSQINNSHVPTQAKKLEDEILRVVRMLEAKGKPPTLNEMRDNGFLGNVEIGKLRMDITDLVRGTGQLAEDRVSRKNWCYTIVKED